MSYSIQVAQLFNNQSVALIGNAPSLVGKLQGPEIERHGTIIRINGAPIPSPASHGRRTSCIATSMRMPRKLADARQAELMLWMTPKILRRPLWAYFDARSVFYPRSQWLSLRQMLNARPSTGIMCAHFLVHNFLPARLSLFGFDGFKSGTLTSTGRTTSPHAFDRELALLNQWQSEGRLTLC